MQTNCVKNLGFILVTKLYFHRHVDYLHSQATAAVRAIFSSLDNLNVLYVTLILSKFVYASVVWSNLTLADSSKLEIIQIIFTNLCYNRFIRPNSFCNYESVMNYLHFKTRYSRRQNLDFLFSLIFSRTNLAVVLVWILLVSVYPLSKLETFRPLTSVIAQYLTVQHDASRLQTASANV
jgi:hypothetical protein